jgi:hypothetical protein
MSVSRRPRGKPTYCVQRKDGVPSVMFFFRASLRSCHAESRQRLSPRKIYGMYVGGIKPEIAGILAPRALRSWNPPGSHIASTADDGAKSLATVFDAIATDFSV